MHPLTDLDTGNSDIISYEIEYKLFSDSDWIEASGITQDSLLTTVQVDGLTNGELYDVRYRAENVHGYSPAYKEAQILLATQPTKIASPADVSQDPATGSIVIDWDAAPDDGGADVDGYTIWFQNKEAEWQTIPECVSTDVTLTECTVPMEVFRDENELNLEEGDFILV